MVILGWATHGIPLIAALWSIILIISSAGPTTAHKERVFEETLSSSPHETDGKHDVKYDQDAFLGEDAKQFLKMTPAESKIELGKIYHKIDTNHDGFVTVEELVLWLQRVHNWTVVSDVQRRWKSFKLEPGEPLTWETYVKYMTSEDGEYGDHDHEGSKEALERDRRRWDACATSGNGTLLYTEASCFLNPELHDHMKGHLANETIEEIDKNGDGLISLDEYMDDMLGGEKYETEPDWARSEREEFKNVRDKNKDGQLDANEVLEWIFPSVDDPVKAEADHLMSECDADNDERLTEQEMLDRYDFLVGHQLTNFGEVLSNHDEL